MNLRFTLNDIWVLNDQPDGWQDLELSLKRDSENVAVYLVYTSEFTFYGDGWQYQKFIIDGVGICGRVPAKIEIDRRGTGNYKLLYQGILNLADFEIDFERCTAKGRLESSSYLSFLTKRFEYDVWFYNRFIEQGTQCTFGGVPVDTQDAAVYVSTHDVVTGAQPFISGLYGVGYRVWDALNYMFQYITENNVTLVSDFFSLNSFQRGKMTVDFAANFSPGDVVNISYVDCYGCTVTASVNVSSGVQATALDQIAKAFCQSGDFATFIGNSASPATADDKAKAAYSIYDGSHFSYATYAYTPGSVWQIQLEHLTPITNLHVTRVSGSASVNTTQSIVYGMKNLFMAFNTELGGDLLGGAIGDKFVSFKELFDMLDARFNLGMQLVEIGPDQFQMRIEPKSYFFGSPQVVNVGSTTSVTAEANTEVLFQNLIVGTKGANANYFKGPSGKNQNWSTGGCSSEVTDKNTDANYDIASIGYQGFNFPENYRSRYPDDVSFFLSTNASYEKGESTSDPVVTEQFTIRVINSHTPPILNGATEGTLYSYNGGLINFWAVYNHLFSFAGSPQTASRSPNDVAGPYIIKNSDVAFSRKNYEFDTVLTDGEAQMCIINPTGAIGFTDSQGTNRSDSLFELSWNVNTCKAHFKVFG